MPATAGSSGGGTAIRDTAVPGVVAGAWVAAIWLWEPLYLLLTVDDAFYYLRIAGNVAEGRGATFDGINPTNGFHPLWLLLLSGLARVVGDDPGLLMRLALSVQVALVLAGVLLLRRSGAPGAAHVVQALAVLLTSFYAAKVLVNGQESALLWLVMCAAMGLYWRQQRGPDGDLRSAVGVGALAGLTTLARLDAVFFAAALVLAPGLWPQAGQRPGLRGHLAQVGAGAAAYAVVMAPYVAWSLATFGHVMPVSGAVKMQYYNVPLPPVLRWGVVAGALAMVPAYVGLCRRWGCDGHPAARLRWLLPAVAGAAMTLAWNVARRGHPLPGIWYGVPYLLALVLAAGVWLEANRGRRRAVMVGAALVGYLAVAAVTWVVRSEPASYSWYLGARRTGLWLRDHTPQDAIIAGWDCGIMAAHSDRRFINLEGLVNSWEYKERYLDRRRVGLYLTQVQPADYVAQYFPVSRLTLTRGWYEGVDLSAWHVARAERVTFRPVLRPWLDREVVFAVLSPGGAGLRWGEWIAQNAASGPSP